MRGFEINPRKEVEPAKHAKGRESKEVTNQMTGKYRVSSPLVDILHFSFIRVFRGQSFAWGSNPARSWFPDELVHLQLETHFQFVLENPVYDLHRLDGPEDRGKQDRLAARGQ